MINVIGIRFEDGGRIYYFSPQNFIINKDEFVVVETERGVQIAQAATDIITKKQEDIFLPLKNIIRIATKDDKKNNRINIIDAQKALNYAQKIVEKENIDMKLYDASYTLDRKKLIFKFIADDRVDFRELAKILAAKYKTRIELRQIGVRDKAKEISGLGPCGRPLCCSTFLTNFNSVSINMAKEQGIALNPNKINGACGRLFCCLGYEDETYSKYRKELPKIGEMVTYGDKSGRVCELDVLKRTYKIKISDNEIITVEKKDESNK